MAGEQPWYANAIIYGIDVAKFADSNGDGIGDFVGLTQRIPYLSDLGITCIWLLPFYCTPDEDNGYDISDYYLVSESVGTRDEFLAFLHKAGEHGIRVIIDLVVNHTSDQHPWFQAARHDNKCRYRDYYVWNHTPPPIQVSEESIFPGEETSVWTYDEVARAYYFHKFYHFEPELNIANPQVRQEILRVVDYWLAFGITGFRIDAAPLLITDNGLKRADPTDHHGIFLELHKFLRERRADGVFLGEVNLAPEELSAYFGGGKQFGLLFNFYMAAHLFAALGTEQAAPIHAALEALPIPPRGCAWAGFLRNLDELDLSKVSEPARNMVFEAFAPTPEMRIFGRGIRRRLAPMLGGDTRRIALAFSLLFSLPGSPLFVYGDEIGLGEDLSQKGRDAVRVPMQWSAETNAGFSKARPSRLTQPVVTKGKFSHKRINVAAQQADPNSLFHRVRALIDLRRRHTVIGEARSAATSPSTARGTCSATSARRTARPSW